MTDRRLYTSRLLHGQVAHQIGREVVSGKVGEGEFLPRESRLAERFGVGRQAVREALKVLAAKGLVGSRRRAGTYVLPRSAWNMFDADVIAWLPADVVHGGLFDEALELRRVIEPAAAEMAARHRSPDRLAAIASALDAMRLAVGRDPEGFNRADTRFHLAILAASGNEWIERLGDIIHPVLDAALARKNNSRQIDDAALIARHEVVFRAIADGNPSKARKATDGILATDMHGVPSAVGRKTA